MLSLAPTRIPHQVYEDLHVVGGAVVVLKREYPREQLWIPFEGMTLFFKAEPRKTIPAIPPQPTPPKFPARPYAVIGDHDRIMYPRDNAQFAKQYVLPFKEHKRLNNGAIKALKKHHFPLWEKNPNAQSKQAIETLFHIDVRGHTRPDIEAWCDETLRGRYFVRGDRTIYFELEFDCMMAKMYFS